MKTYNFLNKKWVYSYTRRMTYQKLRLYHYGYWKGFSDVFGYSQKYEAYRFINGDCSVYFPQSEYDGLVKHLSRKFSDKNFVNKVIKKLPEKIEKDFDEYLKFVRGLPKNLINLSNKEIIELFDEYYKEERTITIDFWTLFGDVEAALIDATNNVLNKSGLSPKEAKEILSKLSEPIKIIPIDMERLSLLRVALLSDLKQKQALAKHYKNFAYFPMYDIDYEEYNLKHFEKKLGELKGEMSVSQIKKEINNIQAKYKNRQNYYKKILNKFKRQKELTYLLKFFSAYSYLKDFKPYTRDIGSFCVKNLFLEVSKRLNLTLGQVLFLSEEETPKLLNKRFIIKPEELNIRMNNSIYFCNEDKKTIITNENELKEIDKIFSHDRDVKEIKGLGVSNGFAKGKVSIILSNNDFGKFKEGEILVTSATRPDFVPLMKKSVAIITDEGGVLSHAAIVSRELKKPCVVGTKIATKALQDGDLVEVDAQKGIVKIIEKNS